MKCEFCGKEMLSLKYKIRSTVTGNQVSYYQCHSCKSISQRPFPNPELLKSYYTSYIDIKKEMNPGYLMESQYEALKKERDKTLHEIGLDLRRIKTGNNVELGCANGHFLRYLVEKGSRDTTGIDISSRLLASIHLDGVTLIEGSLADIATNSTDTLFLFNIVEHISDLENLFGEILRITKEDAQIVIELPLFGMAAKRSHEKWRFFMPDEHVNLPTLSGLKLLLKRHGLVIRGSTRFGSGITTGMAPYVVKKCADFLAKRCKFGDRGAFLVSRSQINRHKKN